jgi:glycosyltransferase involved in cell wall biosynthesis
MKIAVAGTIDTPISASSSAGTEIWTYNLCQELIRQKHNVVLFADGGSKIDGEVVSVCNHEELLDANGQISKSKLAIFTFEQIIKIADRQEEFDLIQISIFSFAYVLPAIKLFTKPVFITVHGSGMNYNDATLFFKRYPDPHYIFSSIAFANNWPAPKHSKIVPHGIKIEDFQYSDKTGDYFFWMSRISSEKRVEDAIEFVIKAKQKLIIAGPVRDQDYFDNYVKPKLNDNITYVGELNFAQKVEYYQKAKAFLFTAKPPEAFGLVAVEALACGTPVVAYNVGAMSEIIENGANGFIVPSGSVEGIVEAARKIDNIKRIDCRNSVQSRFNMESMINQYLDYYKSEINGQ